MSILALTLHGPFAYVDNYPERGFITVMAPMCGQHKAGISGIDPDNEFILTGNQCNHPAGTVGCSPHKYELKFDPGNVSQTTWIGANPLPCAPPPNGYESRDWRFWLKLPKPDVFVGANPVLAEIIPSTDSGQRHPPYSPAQFAVGARFIYKSWVKAPMPLLKNGSPVSRPDPGGPMVFKFADYGEDRGDLDIEYSGPVRDDPDHEDAVKCFENLMKCLGLSWSIYFPSSMLLSTRQNDCKAAIAIVR